MDSFAFFQCQDERPMPDLEEIETYGDRTTEQSRSEEEESSETASNEACSPSLAIDNMLIQHRTASAMSKYAI